MSEKPKVVRRFKPEDETLFRHGMAAEPGQYLDAVWIERDGPNVGPVKPSYVLAVMAAVGAVERAGNLATADELMKVAAALREILGEDK